MKNFLKIVAKKKVVVLAPGAADLSEGVSCLHRGVCIEFEAQKSLMDNKPR
jgi:hypothetical protein